MYYVFLKGFSVLKHFLDFLGLATTRVSSSRSPVLTFMRSLTLWLRRQQELFSLSYWRSLTKRISVRPLWSTHIFSLFLPSYVLSCDKAKLSVCHQHTFRPMMRMEKGSCTLPPPAPCQRLPPCLQNKVCVSHTNRMQRVVCRHR